MKPMQRAIFAVPMVVVLTACDSLPIVLPGADEPERLEPISIESVELADDGRSIRVDFIGAAEFDPADPCTSAYEVTADVDDDELLVSIFPLRHPSAGAGADVECEAVGLLRTAVVELPRPFEGDTVRDLRGIAVFLRPPDGLGWPRDLPDDWQLVTETSILRDSVPRWTRTWALGARWPAIGPGVLTLIQSFDGPVDISGGEQQVAVRVRGQQATLVHHVPSGELVLVWPLGTGEMALVANLADFSQEELIALAASVVADPAIDR